MKNLTILIIATILCSTLSSKLIAQKLYVESGTSITNFEFLNSAGESYESFQPKSYSILSSGYRYFYKEGLSFFGGLGYSGFGAVGSDTTYNNYVDYDLHYVQLNLGGEQEVYSINDQVYIYLKASISAGLMFAGTQVLNNSVYDISEHSDFGDFLLSGYAGLKASVSLCEGVDIYFQALYGINDPIPVNRSQDIERVRMKGANISFGLLFDLIRE